MPSKHLVGPITAVLLLAGCAVGPDYNKPALLMSATYLGQQGAGAQQPTTDLIDIRWWSGFNDPQLSRLVTLALTQNLDIAQARARVAQSRAGLGTATAAMLPSGAIEGQAGRAYQSVETPLGQVLNATPDYNRYGSAFETNLAASWEIDIFGGLRREREAAWAEYQASEAGVAATRLAVAAQTADLYMVIRGLQTRLDIARRQVSTQEELNATIKRLYAKGLAAQLQVNQAEGALSQVRATVPALETERDVALNALDVMLGASPGTYRAELFVQPSQVKIPEITGSGSPEELLRRRPDLIVAERRLAASNARIGAAIAEYYPKLSLSGLLGSATAVSAGNLFTGGASQFSGALGLRWRLFDFGRINAQIDAARGREAELLLAYRLAALRATEDVENAFSALAKRQEQASELIAGVASLKQARGASFAAYQAGIVSLVEVLQADERLLRSSDALAQAHTAEARAAVAAYRALGGGWNAPSPGSI